jgi:hypothetical protein
VHDRQQATAHTMAGMPSVTIRLSINENGSTSVTLASPNLLESAARAIGAAVTIQVSHTAHEIPTLPTTHFVQNSCYYLNFS